MDKQHFLNFWLERHRAFFKDLEPDCRELQLWSAFVEMRAQVKELLETIAKKKSEPETPPENAPAGTAGKYPQLDIFGAPAHAWIEKDGAS